MTTERHHNSRRLRRHFRFLPLLVVLALLAVVPAVPAPAAAAAPRSGAADRALESPPRPKPPTAVTGDASNPPPHEAELQPGPSSPRSAFDPARSVPLEDETTPDRLVFANPDGSKTAELSPRPVRFRDGAGAWRDIDLGLVAGADGSLGAKAATVPATLAARSGETVASVETAAGVIGLRHPGSSPVVATLAGATATYKGALGGRDLVLSLNTDGFEETVVVPDVKGGPSYLDEFLLPAGVSAREAESGIEFVAAGGEVVASFGGGIAFDAGTSTVPVNLRLVPVTTTTTAPGDGGTVATVEVSVDGRWFSDPTRVFPLSIDPLITVPTHAGVGTDTFAWAAAPTTNYGSAAELYIGNVFGATTQSFVKFNYLVVTPSPDVWVSESHMGLLGTYAANCSKPVDVHGIDSTLSASTIWNNRPQVDGPLVSTTTLGASCAALWNNFDTTALARRWLTDGAPNNGLRVAATNDADPASWKRFASNNTANPPFLYITYTHRPAPSTPVTPAPGTVLASPNATLTSTLADDPDGEAVQYWFRATTDANAETGPKVVDSGWVTSPTYTVLPGSLVDGSTYYWHVITWDGVVGGMGGTYTYGPVVSFRVDTHQGTATDSVGPVSVDLASGNASVAHTSPAMASVGGPVGLSYS